MPTDCISYRESGYFTPLINDYLDQAPHLAPLYNRFPTLANFEAQIAEKQAQFPAANRKLLVTTLQKQYAKLETGDAVARNIQALAAENAFTITTGHQLNLFTGPLYFLYKIVSAINLSKNLQQRYPDKQFIPVYWMATEDHDFDEINHFNFNGRKVVWNRESAGAVGRLDTNGLEDVYKVFKAATGIGQSAEKLGALFKTAYLEHDNLANATRYLAHELFGAQGLVIIDADDAGLKSLFGPYAEKELLEQFSFEATQKSIAALKGYNIQVNPREINLFYLEDGLRERIEQTPDGFAVVNSSKRFTEAEIKLELQQHPERFSPNVILRPLYQEIILPNLCYIGGGGELAYWFELKAVFEQARIAFPMLLLRNSVLLATEKQEGKMQSLALSWKDVFLQQDALMREKAKALSSFPIDLTPQKEALAQQFDFLLDLATKTDASFTGAVKAQQTKQTKGLEKLERRLLKAQRRKYEEVLSRVKNLQDELFPAGALQERKENFAAFYLQEPKLIEKLLAQLDPLQDCFKVVLL